MIKYELIGFFSVCLSCVSQTLLKKSALKTWKSHIREYMNAWVMGGYALMAVCVFLTIYMYSGLQLKFGAVIESLGYVIILLISKFVFGEQITKNKVVGNILIIVGIIVFNLDNI